MDMKTGVGAWNRNVRRKEILEPEEVEVGYLFILKLVSWRLADTSPRPSGKKERQERFSRDKHEVARSMGYHSYDALPKGAKSFESRCSSLRRLNPQMKYSTIARFEKEYNRHLSDTLRKDIEKELEQYAESIKEKEKRRYLMRRMCCYSIPFVFT